MTTAFCTYYERGRSGRGVLCDVRHPDGTWTPRVWVGYDVWTACGGTSGDTQVFADQVALTSAAWFIRRVRGRPILRAVDSNACSMTDSNSQ